MHNDSGLNVLTNGTWKQRSTDTGVTDISVDYSSRSSDADRGFLEAAYQAEARDSCRTQNICEGKAVEFSTVTEAPRPVSSTNWLL